MKQRGKTSTGGSQEAFPATHWSVILQAESLEKPERRQVADQLIQDYWKPVYCYLRRKGYPNETAKDLTQGFFHEIFLGRELTERAHPEKGRFRTFLLTALDRYVIDVYRKEKAVKRSAGRSRIDFDMRALSLIPEDQSVAPPDQVFHYAWATALLDQVLSQVRQKCSDLGKEIHWQVFEARVLTPIMTGETAPSMTEICTQFDIPTESQGSNMIVTVKRRMRRAVRDALGQQVECDADIEAEIQDLIEILADPGAI